jgi:hypothetical protein
VFGKQIEENKKSTFEFEMGILQTSMDQIEKGMFQYLVNCFRY